MKMMAEQKTKMTNFSNIQRETKCECNDTSKCLSARIVIGCS